MACTQAAQRGTNAVADSSHECLTPHMSLPKERRENRGSLAMSLTDFLMSRCQQRSSANHPSCGIRKSSFADVAVPAVVGAAP